jgi:hypothetical protein
LRKIRKNHGALTPNTIDLEAAVTIAFLQNIFGAEELSLDDLFPAFWAVGAAVRNNVA